MYFYSHLQRSKVKFINYKKIRQEKATQRFSVSRMRFFFYVVQNLEAVCFFTGPPTQSGAYNFCQNFHKVKFIG